MNALQVAAAFCLPNVAKYYPDLEAQKSENCHIEDVIENGFWFSHSFCDHEIIFEIQERWDGPCSMVCYNREWAHRVTIAESEEASRLMAKGLFALGILYDFIAEELGGEPSAHERLEWTLEYEARLEAQGINK